MKNRASTSLRLLAVAAALPLAQAGEPIEQPNRISFAPRLGFNVKASFRSSLASTGANPGPATGGGLDRVYDDGYVKLDSSGNAGGQTWNWGYENDGQVDPVGGTLALSAVAGSDPAVVNNVDDDPLVGGELTYTRYLFEFGHANWGFEIGGTYTPVSISDGSTLSANANLVRDLYPLNGITPPAAPYHGTFAGPGPVIGDSPTRTPTTEGVAFSGNRKLESSVFGIRLGPNLDIPMGNPLSLQLSGGLYMQYADSKFTYSETASLAGGATQLQSGSVSQQDWVVGGYVRGQLTVALSRTIGLFAGVEYVFSDQINLGTPTHQATLDLDGAAYGMAGLAFKF